MEQNDGDIDYSGLSLRELLDVERHIDAHNNPKNYASLQHAIEIARSERVEAEAPVQSTPYLASFWQRLGAHLLDFLIVLPFVPLVIWGTGQTKFFYAYFLLPQFLFVLWYYVHLVKTYGGTPGKLLMNIRIVTLAGDPVDYKHAALRESVMIPLWVVSTIGLTIGALRMADAEYLSLDWIQRIAHMEQFAPSWYRPVSLLTNIWVWSEFLVMLTNEKRRAIHDFIAGTIVVRADAIRPDY